MRYCLKNHFGGPRRIRAAQKPQSSAFYVLTFSFIETIGGAHCAPAIFITECTINHICRAGCPHPAAERHHKIVPPAHVTARPTGRCKHRPLQISFSVRGKILPFFPFNTFSSSSSYKKRAQRPIFIGAVRVLLTPNS